jgi:MYND finger
MEEEARLGYSIEQALKKRKKCAGCSTVFYCSPDCQVVDWKARHRKRCKELKALAAREKALAEGVESALLSDEPISDADLQRAQELVDLLDDPKGNYYAIADMMERNELTVPGVFRAAVQRCDMWAKVVSALRFDEKCFRENGGRPHGEVSNHLLFTLLPGRFLQPSGGFNRLDPGRSLAFAQAGGLPALVDLCFEAEQSVRRQPHELWRDRLMGYGRIVSLLLTPGNVSEHVLRHNFQTRQECLNLNALMLDPTHDSYQGLLNQAVGLLYLHAKRLGIRSDLLAGGKRALIRLGPTSKLMFEQYAVPSAQQMIDKGRSAKHKEAKEIWDQDIWKQ